MAEPKHVKTRIINKHATAAVWGDPELEFTPLQGELIIYDKDDDYTYERFKIGDGTRDVKELPFISDVANKSLNVTSDGKLSLNQEYIDYLDKQLYAYPEIEIFNIVGSSNVEVGTTVNISAFKHKETNSKNINGNLTLTSNNTNINLSVTPSDNQVTVNFKDSYTFEEVETLKYTLKGKNTRGETIEEKTYSITSYFPSFIGALNTATINASQINNLTKKSSGALKGTHNIPANSQYVYFVTTTKINNITSGGFNVDYSQQSNISLDINGVVKSYYVYKTNESILSTMTYVIS